MVKRKSESVTATAPKRSTGGAKSVQAKAKVSSNAKKTTRKSAAKSKKSETIVLSQDQIAQRAYEIWDSKGRPYGLDQEIWFEAKRQLSISGV